MPAVKQSYDYYDKPNNHVSGVARNARSVSASPKMSAQNKVSSHSSAQKKAKQQQNQAVIDAPVVVKKKVALQKPDEMKLEAPKSQEKQKTTSAKKSIIATVVGFSFLLMICVRYAQINELTHQLSVYEKELASAQSLNEQLNVEVNSKTDLNHIEKYAKYQLGMQKPSESQVVRIPYDKQDKISVPIVIAEEKEPGFLEKMWKDILNLVD